MERGIYPKFKVDEIYPVENYPSEITIQDNYKNIILNRLDEKMTKWLVDGKVSKTSHVELKRFYHAFNWDKGIKINCFQ